MKNSLSVESVPSFMQWVFTATIDNDIMVLQKYTNAKKGVQGPCGETYPTSDHAYQAENVKAGEVSEAEEDENPVPIEFLEIKAEPEVSFMSVCPLSGMSKHAVVFLISVTVHVGSPNTLYWI
jgi:hypothetical protein